MYAACTQDNKHRNYKKNSEKKSTKCRDGTLADKVHKQGKDIPQHCYNFTQPFLHK